MLTVVLQAIVIYSSIIFGKLLHLIAGQEVKQGKKYLFFARNVLILLASAALLHLNFKPISVLFLLVGFGVFILLKKVNSLVYLLLGSAAFLVLLTSERIILLSFIFLLAMTHSSLSAPKKKEVLISSFYLIIPFILFFIETFIKGNLDIFTSLVAGGLLAQLKGP